MIPRVVTQTGTGTTVPVIFDNFRTPFSVSIGCVATGTVSYTIQHTFDNLMNILPSAANWFNNDNANLVNATTSQDGNYNAPIFASRLVINSGTGTVITTYTQAGLMGD